MSTDYQFVALDLYQECIEPLEADTQKKMPRENKNKAYQHACQWTTLYPNSSSDLS